MQKNYLKKIKFFYTIPIKFINNTIIVNRIDIIAIYYYYLLQ